MGGIFYWGEENNPNRQTAPDEPAPRRLRVSDLSYGHTPDRHRRPARGHEDDPIQVRRGWLGGLRVVDGSARLAVAIERGDTYITGQVWD